MREVCRKVANEESNIRTMRVFSQLKVKSGKKWGAFYIFIVVFLLHKI